MSSKAYEVMYWGLVGGVVGVTVGAVVGRPGIGGVAGAVAGGAILPLAFAPAPRSGEIPDDSDYEELPDLGERVRVHRVDLGGT